VAAPLAAGLALALVLPSAAAETEAEVLPSAPADADAAADGWTLADAAELADTATLAGAEDALTAGLDTATEGAEELAGADDGAALPPQAARLSAATALTIRGAYLCCNVVPPSKMLRGCYWTMSIASRKAGRL
jgi:hypothetical protein